jgi:hypothetical protein
MATAGETSEAVATLRPVERVAQAITFRTPGPLTLGDPAVALLAMASSGQPVTFRAEGSCAITSGVALVPTGAGTCTVTATQDGDEAWAAAEPVVRTFTIGRAPQSIAVDVPSDAIFGAEPLELSPSATSGLPVAIEAKGPCSVEDSRLATTGAGVCTLTFGQPGDDRWAPAADVVHDLTIERAAQVVRLGSLGSHRLGDPPVAIAASASSGLPVTIEAEGPCQLDAAGRLVLAGVGSCSVTVSQPGNEDWVPAVPLVRELDIEHAPQTIAFEAPTAARFGDPAIALDATASSGLPVALSADGPCRLADDHVTLTMAGRCTLTARQEGDDRWAAAAPVVREISVARAAQSITFEPLEEALVTADPRPLEGTATSGLAVAYRAEGPCEIVDGAVRPTGAGLCAVTAVQPGDLRFAAAAEVQRVFRVRRVPQSIDFSVPRSATLGDPPIELSAVASSGMPVTFAARGACSVVGSSRLALDAPGRCTVVALQAGDGTWAPAEDVPRVLSVNAPQEQPSVAPTEPGADPVATPDPPLADEDQPLPCAIWRRISGDDDAAGAIEGVECADDLPGIARYALYRFADVSTLARRFTEHAAAARPALGVSEDACEPAQSGARPWDHGWLACWLPEGAPHAEIRWTDERTRTYGVLESTDERFTPLYERWAEDQRSTDSDRPTD